MNPFSIRLIEPEDNPAAARVIREVMTDFGAVGPGYSIADPEVDYLYETYQAPRSRMYVVVDAGDRVVGCGGIAPLKGADLTVCEVQKMYYLPEARGHGMGQKLLQLLLVDAIGLAYQECYLETLERMDAANKLYRKAGFLPTMGPMGCTGHDGCDLFYVKGLI